MVDELDTRAFAGLSGTDYTFLATTDMSARLDGLFGFNYISQIAEHGVHSERDRGLALKILVVNRQPVKGLTGELVIPVSKEADYNLRSARCFLIGSHESEKVADFFSGQAKKVGFFFALPYDEIVNSGKSNLSARDIQTAVDEGYVRIGVTTVYSGQPIRMAELTDKFCPVEKRM